MWKISVIGMALWMGCLTVSAQRRQLTAAEAAVLKEKTSAHAKSLQSLESKFTQTKQLSYLDEAVQSAGKLYFKAPKKIRWEYTHPSPYTVVFNGDKMYTRDERGKIASTDLAANRRLKGLNELLKGAAEQGDLFDEERFAITYHQDGSAYTAVMVPKEKALSKYIKQVELTIDGTTFLIKRVKIVDPSTDYTQLDFKEQRTNVTIPEDQFMAK